MEKKILIGICFLLGILLTVGNYFRLSEIKQLEDENKNILVQLENNKTLTKKYKEMYEQKSVEPKNRVNETKTDLNNNEFKLFNEKFITALNINDNIDKNNKFLKSVSNDEAQQYLKENNYIYERNHNTEENSDSKSDEQYKIAEVKLTTENIQTYERKLDDNNLTAVTLYKVITDVNGEKTEGNYIAKIEYTKINNEWKVNKIYSISPVSDEQAKGIFHN